jgi:tRNA/rRNA methyltransferase
LIRTRFVLIETSHAGNVGAAARAMKVMGFDDLVLVRPRWDNVLRKEETIQRSSGALDVLAKAKIVDTLDEALEGMTHTCATAMTSRDFGPPTRSPREHLASFIRKCSDPLGLPQQDALLSHNNSAHTGIAFLFGSERFGMSNEDVYKCNVALKIDSNPQFGSLNLGAAVQLIAYEWRNCLGGFTHQPLAGLVSGTDRLEPAPEGEVQSASHTGEVLADAAQIQGLLTHWQSALERIGFLDPAAPKKLMPRLNQLFNRAHMTPEEVHIFRGIAKAMIKLSEQNHSVKSD